MGAFRWLMDDMTRLQGEQAMSYDDVMAYVHNTGRTYWIGRFYKKYNGLIDGYITFSHSTRYYHFIMDYDPQHVQIGVNYDGYPTPAHFYLARAAIMTGTSWTIAEYNAVPDPHEAPIPAGPIPAAPPAVPINALPPIAEYNAVTFPAAPIPTDEATIEEGGAAIEEGETDEAAIEEGGTAIEKDDGARRQPIDEGGTVFLCNGMFLFCFPFFSPARVLFFISYCFDYSRVFDFFRFPIFFRM